MGDGGGGMAECRWSGWVNRRTSKRRDEAEMVRGGVGNFVFFMREGGERGGQSGVGCRVRRDERLLLSVFVILFVEWWPI